MTAKSKNLIYPALVILTCLLFEMSSDLYLPSLPEMSVYFRVSEHTTVNTISAYLLGFALLGLVAGPLSDSYGRRWIFHSGVILFAMASIGCVFSEDINPLTFWRFCQGLGAGISMVVATAIIKDAFGEAASSRIFSLMGTIIALSPTVAPVVGGFISTYFGWQANFLIIMVIGVLTVFICLALMPESLDKEARRPFTMNRFSRSYGKLLTNKRVVGYAMLSGITYGGLWAWIATAPFYFIEILGVSEDHYGYYAAFGPGAYIIGAYINQRNVEKVGIDNMFRFGFFVLLIGCLSLFTTANLYPESIPLIILSIVVYAVGLAPVFSNAAARCVDVVPHKRGTASAILSLFEMALAALFAYVVSLFTITSLVPASILMGGSVLFCTALYFWGLQGVRYESTQGKS